MYNAGYVSRTIEKPEIRPPIIPLSNEYAPREHPISTKNYILPTDEMFSLYEYILDAIDLGYEGSIIYGGAYTGKTIAVMEVEEWLQKEHDNDFLTFRVTLADKKYRCREFYQYLSERMGCHLPVKTTDTNRVAENLIASLVHMAHKHNNKIVLILDEVEHLGMDHYGYLKFIFNRLREHGVIMITFLVGTDSLLNTKALFEQSGSGGEQITRRFMQGTHHFRGICDTEQMRFVLSGYDNLTFYDETFTEHYFPVAWAKGMRLTDLTDLMIEVMLEVSGLSKLPEFPMGYLTKIIQALFLTFGADSTKTDGRNNSLKREWITRQDIHSIMVKQDIDRKLIELNVRTYDKDRKGRRL